MKSYKKITSIGVAFSFQKYNKLPTNSKDYRLNYIITEKGIFLMKILILGDVVGSSGRKAIKTDLKQIIKKNNIDFSVINGENSADDGKGITQEIADEFFQKGWM